MKLPLELVAAAANYVVCRDLDVDWLDVIHTGRVGNLPKAREVFCGVCRCLSVGSFPEIARAMCRANHSTALTAARRFDESDDRDDWIARVVVRLMNSVAPASATRRLNDYTFKEARDKYAEPFTSAIHRIAELESRPIADVLDHYLDNQEAA